MKVTNVEDVATDILTIDTWTTEVVAAATDSQNEPGIIYEEELHMVVYLTENFKKN